MTNRKNFKKCRICDTDLTNKPWISQWEAGNHYKVNTCDRCGKKSWIIVEFEGSGHDKWKPGKSEEDL